MLTIIQALFGYLARIPSAIIRGWDKFFFTPRDPIVLGFIRIVVGTTLFYIHISTASCVLDFIGPHAWADQEALTELKYIAEHPNYQLHKDATNRDRDIHAMDDRNRQFYGFSIWYWITDPFWIQVTYYAGIVCVGLFTLGFQTRLTSILSWAFHLSYLHRSLIIWFGMDAMLSFMLLYLCISPCGKTVSLDRLIKRWRLGKDLPAVLPTWDANLAIRLMQLHMCVVYFIAGIAKLQGKTWWQGLATWLTMNAPLFNESLDISWLTGDYVGEWFWSYFCFATTYATLAFEIGFPFLIWNRYLRPWMLFGAFCLHVGIGLFMGLGGFGAVMLSGCMSFIPTGGMRWFLHSLFGNGNHKVSVTNN